MSRNTFYILKAGKGVLTNDKKGFREMKLRRCLLVFSLLTIMIFSVATITYASSDTYTKRTVKSYKTSISIDAQVDFYDAWWCVAYGSYSATLTGSNDDTTDYLPDLTTYVKLQDENQTVITNYFTIKQFKLSGSKSMPWAEFATLVVRCYDHTELLIDRNDD